MGRISQPPGKYRLANSKPPEVAGVYSRAQFGPGLNPPALFRTFHTRQIDDSTDFIRTFGTVVEKQAGMLHFPEEEAIRYAHPAPPPNCARGKVVAFSRGNGSCEAVCYQLSDSRTKGRVVACCNATAAAAASFALATGSDQVSMRLELPSPGRACVEARVERGSGASPAIVHQTWSGLAFSVRDEAQVDGRWCAVCASALNNYLIIQTLPNESAAGFSVGEAVRLWRHFDLSPEPLVSRIAVVQSPADPKSTTATAKFFTCEREHPSAPLTGLAALALAAGRLEWLALHGVDRIDTHAGPLPLPRVSVASDGTAGVEIPRVLVSFDFEPATASMPPGWRAAPPA